MATLATVQIQFKSVGGNQVKKDTNDVLNLMKGLGAQIGVATSLAELFTTAIIGAVKGIAQLTVAAFENYKSFETNISALAMYQTTLVGTSNQLQRLRTLSLEPGLSLDQVLKGVTYLEAAGFSAKVSERAIKEFGNALALAGKGSEDLAGVQLALGQIKSKGIISAEEINQIAERVPQVRAAIVKAFGTGNTKALQEMQIPATEFITKVTDQLAKLQRAPRTIASTLKNVTDSFKYSNIIIGKGFNDLINASAGFNNFKLFFENLKQISIEFSSVLTGLSKSDAYKEFQKNIKDTLTIFHSLIPGMTRSFAIGLSLIMALTNDILKAGNTIYNFFGQLFHEPIKLWEKEWGAFVDFMSFALIEPFKIAFNFIEQKFYGLKKLASLPGTAAYRNAASAEAESIFQGKFLQKRLDEALSGQRARQSPLVKMVGGIGDLGQSLLPSMLKSPNETNDLFLKALNIYDDIMRNKAFDTVLPAGLKPGGMGPVADTIEKGDEKNGKKLDLIVQSTQKQVELTLRNLTYGGGELAAQGLSSVQMQNSKTYGRATSSPVINATNDITRGVEKIVRGYSGSNNLNFNFRRS